jgi:hypothetical protein
MQQREQRGLDADSYRQGFLRGVLAMMELGLCEGLPPDKASNVACRFADGALAQWDGLGNPPDGAWRHFVVMTLAGEEVKPGHELRQAELFPEEEGHI